MRTCLILISILAVLSQKDNLKQDLYKKLQDLQWTKDQKFIFMVHFEQQKGLYQSEVKCNIIDKQNTWKTTQFRQWFHVDDNNMFVTNFVLMALLDAYELGSNFINEDSFNLSLETLISFKDKNYEQQTPIFNFWPQELINGTWSASPVNLNNLVDMYPNFPESVKKFFDNHGLAFFNQIKSFKSAFRIPADNDDSSVNAALYATLARHKQDFPGIFSKLEKQNYNYEAYYNLALKYAYRPYVKGKDIIDPRSYFYLHPFISQYDSLILASTWLTDESQRKPGIVEMPLQTNNVDISVNANFLFGLTNQVINGVISLSGELRQMYSNIADLLYWAIRNNVPVSRPDIALLYYPSQFDFYWFNSRLVRLVIKQSNVDELIMQTAEKLLESLRKVTFFQDKMICSEEYCFADEFLGDFGNENRGEDRIFATSLMVNILLDIWTDSNNHFVQDTPEDVKLNISKCIKFIEDNYKKKQQLKNVFFSGSFKTLDTFPFFYPSNIDINSDGSKIDPQQHDTKDIQHGFKCAWEGVVSDDEYEKLLNLKWFGKDVPKSFAGFNNDPGFGFPFWSSDAISYAMSLLAVTKFEKL